MTSGSGDPPRAPVRDRSVAGSDRDPALVVAVVGTAVGLAHLLVPEWLLAVARRGYDRILAVNFRPRENATARVRAVGLAVLAASAVLAALGRRGGDGQ